MKKVLHVLFLFTAIALVNSNAIAQAYLVHYWNFNTFRDTVRLPTLRYIKANFSRLDTNKATVVYQKSYTSVTDSAYVDYYPVVAADYDSVNLRMGDTAGNGMRLRNPSDSMELRMYIPSRYYKNLKLTYASMRSNNGMLQQRFDYSTDSGTTWITTGLSIAMDSPTTTFKRTTIRFGSDTTVNNNSKLVFRIKFRGNTVGTSGNNRFDNITLDADSVTTGGISTITSVVKYEPLSVYPNPTQSNLTISLPTNGIKAVTIHNLQGATLWAGIVNGANPTLDIANLPIGIYTATIQDGDTNKYYTATFVKE
ncbi:MAG: T9SS C-terminal target domain-containing protein [Chitinophagia bacterium]|nr:T9SS C-terminal target domain-containing protein [Chitinophagia bacterium]